MNLWFRMYFEFEDDPKVQMMPEEMQRRLTMLFCERCKGERRTDAERAFKWHITEAQLAETKALFLAKNFIDEKWNLQNWNKRQFISDSSTERVKKHRANQGLKQDETLQVVTVKQSVTVPDTDTDSEADTEKPIHAPSAKSASEKPSSARRAKKRDKTLKKKTKSDLMDERYVSFKEAIRAYWDKKNPNTPMLWGPMEGQQLGCWLREAPHITLKQFREFLCGRYESDVNHAERPSQWIRWIASYEKPLTKFKTPKEETNGSHQNQNGSGKSHGSPTKQRVNDNLLAIAEAAHRRGVPGFNADGSGNGKALPEPGLDGFGGGNHAGLRAISVEVFALESPKSAHGSAHQARPVILPKA